jgi:ABC-type Fe3+-hydroxamate transport system substrate-binding protein
MIERPGALGTVTRLARPARRVVSLVPSETEAVAMLGAGDRLVGRTDYCVEPAAALAEVVRVGGTKDARLDAIVALAPDLVLANQEENTEALVAGLTARGIAVHLSFPKTVADAVTLQHDLAVLLGLDPATHPLLARLRAAVAEAEARRARTRPVRVFCPIWMDPLMTVHADTYISDVLDLCGGANVFADRPRRYPLAADLGRAPAWSAERVGARDTRYPRVTLDEVVALQPEVVLLPDEPHPFSDADAEVFRRLDIPAARAGRVHRTDGKALCWYSPRLIDALPRVADWLRGEVATGGLPSRANLG